MNTESKLQEAKRKVDLMVGLPGVTLRKGVARSGDALTGYIDYNYKLLRDDDRRWLLYVEWVDSDGEGHRITLPHEVIAAVLLKADSIISQARKDRAKHAAETRRQKAVRQAEIILEGGDSI